MVFALSACIPDFESLVRGPDPDTGSDPVFAGGSATITQEEVNAAQSEFIAVLDDLIAGDLTHATMPNSGTASYDGNIVLKGDNDYGFNVIGDLALDANFETQKITGSATNFNSLDVQNYPTIVDPTYQEVVEEYVDTVLTLVNAATGELSINGDMTNNEFEATLQGELTGAGWLTPEDLTAVIDATMYGTFLTSNGSSPEGVFGDVVGSVNVDGTTETVQGLFEAN